MALSNEECIDTKQPHYSDNNNNNMLNMFTSVDDNDNDTDADDEFCYACSSSLTTVRKSLSPAHCSKNKSKDEIEEEDGFYHKLNRINEPSGLSLLFNLRDTSMDLHEFYDAVTKEGGYQQVTKDGKWEDVASSLNRMNQVPFTATQLLQLYAIILYPFERTYFYRSSVKLDKVAVTHDISQVSWISNFGSGKVLEGYQSNASIMKRKHDDGLYATRYIFSDVEPPNKKIEFNNGYRKSSPVAMIDEKKSVLGMPIKVKETRKDPCAPVGSRNCYQMYVKMESNRLKSIHGDAVSGRQLRDMLAEIWKHLSTDDKLAYVEASKKDKERYLRELAAYEEHKRELAAYEEHKRELAAYEEHKRQQLNQPQNKTNRVIKFSDRTFIDFTKPAPREIAHELHMISRHSTGNQKVLESVKSGSTKKDDDYHAALQPDDDDDDYEIGQVSNEPRVQMAFGLMKNARPHDPIFHVDWEI